MDGGILNHNLLVWEYIASNIKGFVQEPQKPEKFF